MLRYKSVLLAKSLLGKVINMTESLKVSNSGISDEFKGLEDFRRKIQKKRTDDLSVGPTGCGNTEYFSAKREQTDQAGAAARVKGRRQGESLL